MEYVQVNFSQGEVSPAWFGRVDVGTYATACARLENFLVLPTGGVTKRPGTKYIGATKSNGAARLYAFRTSATESIVVEFGNLYARFWNDAGQIESGGSPVEVVTPYTTAQLYELRFAQIQNVLYIFHRAHAVRTLTYTSATSWSIAAPSVTNGKAGLDLTTADERAGAGTFYEQRLIVAGSNDEPNAIAGSQSGIPLTFTTAATAVASDGFKENPQGYERIDIKWLLGQGYLLIGSTDGLWRAGALDAALDASQLNGVLFLRRQSSVGTANIQGIGIGDYAVFVERGGKRIRLARYQDSEQQFITPSLSLPVDHFFESHKATELSYQLVPNPILWVTRDSDGPVAFSYDEVAGTAGWSRIEVGGDVESLCVAPGDGEDAVWVVVKRTVGGSTVRYVERFQNQSFTDEDACFYVDSGLDLDYGAAKTVSGVALSSGNPVEITATGHGFSNGHTVRFSGVGGTTELNGVVYTVANAATNTFELQNTDGDDFTAYTSGGSVERVVNTATLAHLAGKDIAVWADGAVQPTQTADASTGEITLAKFANRVIVGLPYTARIDTLPVSAALTKAKRTYKTTLRFLRTITGKVGASFDDLQDINFLDTAFVMGAGPDFFTGIKETYIQGNVTVDSSLVVVSDKPTPMTVLQIMQEVSVEEAYS